MHFYFPGMIVGLILLQTASSSTDSIQKAGIKSSWPCDKGAVAKIFPVLDYIRNCNDSRPLSTQ